MRCNIVGKRWHLIRLSRRCIFCPILKLGRQHQLHLKSTSRRKSFINKRYRSVPLLCLCQRTEICRCYAIDVARGKFLLDPNFIYKLRGQSAIFKGNYNDRAVEHTDELNTLGKHVCIFKSNNILRISGNLWNWIMR